MNAVIHRAPLGAPRLRWSWENSAWELYDQGFPHSLPREWFQPTQRNGYSSMSPHLWREIAVPAPTHTRRFT